MTHDHTSTQHAIPSMTGVDHIAYNVPDMEQALAFFVDVLGCELLDRQPPHAFSLDAGTSIQTAVVRYDEHINFELLECRFPGQDTRMPDMRDVGGYHLALTVTDVPAAVAYLRTISGVAVREVAPLPNGRQRAFFTTPWGMSMQIIEPAGESIF